MAFFPRSHSVPRTHLSSSHAYLLTWPKSWGRWHNQWVCFWALHILWHCRLLNMGSFWSNSLKFLLWPITTLKRESAHTTRRVTRQWDRMTGDFPGVRVSPCCSLAQLRDLRHARLSCHYHTWTAGFSHVLLMMLLDRKALFLWIWEWDISMSGKQNIFAFRMTSTLFSAFYKPISELK